MSVRLFSSGYKDSSYYEHSGKQINNVFKCKNKYALTNSKTFFLVMEWTYIFCPDFVLKSQKEPNAQRDHLHSTACT